MTNQHPITPPPELVQQWRAAASNVPATYSETGVRFDYIDYIATRATQWGADQELEACCEWVEGSISTPEAAELRAARRPKPPSLKEQALEAAIRLSKKYSSYEGADIETIRRILVALAE